MAILKKSVKECVEDILKKEEKIKSRINEIDSKIKKYEDIVKDKYDELIDCELEEDEEKQAVCNKEIKKYNAEITDLKNLLNGYSNKLNNFKVSNKELDKIKSLALADVEKRTKKHNKVADEVEKYKEQLKELEELIRKTEMKYESITKETDYSRDITKIIKYIDPLAEKLRDQYFKNDFIETWLHDGDLEQIFISQGLKERQWTAEKSYVEPFLDDEEYERRRREELINYNRGQ